MRRRERAWAARAAYVTYPENQPFAIVLPQNAGNIAFYDVDGNPVAFLEETV